MNYKTTVVLSYITRARLLIALRELREKHNIDIDQRDVLELIMRTMSLDELIERIKVAVSISEDEYKQKFANLMR